MLTYASFAGVAELISGVTLADVLSLYCLRRHLPAGHAPELGADGDLLPEPGVALQLIDGALSYDVSAVLSHDFPAHFRGFLEDLSHLAARGWVSFEAVADDEPAPVFRGADPLHVATCRAAYLGARLETARKAYSEALAEVDRARRALHPQPAGLH